MSKEIGISQRQVAMDTAYLKLEELRIYEVTRISKLIADTSNYIASTWSDNNRTNQELIDRLADLHRSLGRITGETTLLDIEVQYV